METMKVVNVKCEGCENIIKKELALIGATNIEIGFSKNDSSKSREIRFNGDLERVKITLSKLGYPEVGSKEAKNLLKKAKSFVSCAMGKIG